MPSLRVDHEFFTRQSDRLLDLVEHLDPLEPRYQKLAAETVFLRLFALLEVTIQSICAKIQCGCQYVDGSQPLILVRARSKADAMLNMQTVGRPKPKHDLRWTKASDIKDNVRNVVQPGDHLIHTVDVYGMLIDEMRRVRNHIAHNSTSTRNQFKVVVVRYYGAYVNTVSAGVLLMSGRRAPVLLKQYIQQAKIVVKDLTKA